MQVLLGLIVMAALVTIVVAVLGILMQLLRRRPVHRWALIGGFAVLLIIVAGIAGGVIDNNVVAFIAVICVVGAGWYFDRHKRDRWRELRETADERAATRRVEKEHRVSTRQAERQQREAEERRRREQREAEKVELRKQKQAEKEQHEAEEAVLRKQKQAEKEHKASARQAERRQREAEERRRREQQEAEEAQLRKQKQAEKERRAAANQAEKEQREAKKAYKSRLKQAERELRRAEEAYQGQVQSAERDLQRAREQGSRKLASYKGKNSTVQLFENRLLTRDGEAMFESGPVEATVDTAGNLAVTRRATLTRFLALGGIGAIAFTKREVIDVRELYLLIETPGFVSLIPCNPNDGAKVRQFAAQIKNAYLGTQSVQEIANINVLQAERELSAAKNDRAAIEAAEQKLAAVKRDT